MAFVLRLISDRRDRIQPSKYSPNNLFSLLSSIRKKTDEMRYALSLIFFLTCLNASSIPWVKIDLSGKKEMPVPVLNGWFILDSLTSVTFVIGAPRLYSCRYNFPARRTSTIK